MSDQLFTEDPTDSEEEDPEKQSDPELRFPPDIRVVKGDHLNPKSPGSQQYTVWCSDGYEGDQWHGYDGPPNKEFDSIWATKDEANMRAEYLFYWKNPRGISAAEMYDNQPKQTEQEGLKKFTTCPDDSSHWTVGVVPSVAFPWLDNVSLRRHGYDKEKEAEKKQNYGYSNWRY